ncbi:hypothetical protein BAE44_0008374 [Dichanthelium oligosanthes]|uniref:Uncharacterized protein n=1 Tax=Dichanthelium oligosanthes TaxID=888268 RepID=A0A1E5VZP4_9POAL|nr:hypothetical protein BAE44_0008374 [Dichanthelium oligosanthes]
MVEKQGTCITIQCRHAAPCSSSSSDDELTNRYGWMHAWIDARMVLHVPIFSTQHKLSQHASPHQVR